MAELKTIKVPDAIDVSNVKGADGDVDNKLTFDKWLEWFFDRAAPFKTSWRGISLAIRIRQAFDDEPDRAVIGLDVEDHALLKSVVVESSVGYPINPPWREPRQVEFIRAIVEA